MKKRAAGEVGSAIPRSKSASNIISLKAPVKEKQTKRISFGETETRTMAPREDIRSRLGYGRQSSPPPELEGGAGGDNAMQTKIQKIALGGGKFEMRKVMKMVKTELGRPSPERTKEVEQRVTLTAPKTKTLSAPLSSLRPLSSSPTPSPSSSRMSAAGAFAAESRISKAGEDVTKLKISVKNDMGRAAGKRYYICSLIFELGNRLGKKGTQLSICPIKKRPDKIYFPGPYLKTVRLERNRGNGWLCIGHFRMAQLRRSISAMTTLFWQK